MEAASIPTEPQTVEPTPVPVEAVPTPTPAPGPGVATPDLSEQVADLTQRMTRVEEPAQEQAPVATDLFSALTAGEEQAPGQLTETEEAQLRAAGIDPTQLNALAAAQYPPQPDPRDQRIEQLAAQVQQMSDQDLDARLNAIAEKHTDILEPAVFAPLQQRLQSLAQRHGDQVLTDPDTVQMAYEAVKAQQAEAAATPAEQAAKGGATLETSAGRSAQGGENPSEQFADKLLGAGGGSAFTQ